MDFEKYRNFTVADFAEDEQFWRWFMGQNDEYAPIWQELIAALPEKKEIILEARNKMEMLCQMGIFPDFL